MKVALTGASGFVGWYILRLLLAHGHDVTVLGRHPTAQPAPTHANSEAHPSPAGRRPTITHRPWALGDTPDLAGIDALVHAGFSHIPGRYRGGEGSDPEGFRRSNVGGTAGLFEAARSGGVGKIVLLSSRAVFDGYPPGTTLREDLPPAPTNLYGAVKAEAEAHLAALAIPSPVILRATGVYGRPPQGPHKWAPLFAALREGSTPPPRVATEVHAWDLARAVVLALGADRTGPLILHASDLVLDTADLVPLACDALRIAPVPPPPRTPTSALSTLDTSALHALGWRPGGWPLLRETLRQLAAQA